MILFFLIFFLGVFLLLFLSRILIPSTIPSKKPYLCFLSVRPSMDFYDLCVRFVPFYNVFVCVDDNDYPIPWNHDQIQIIRLPNQLCEENGYHSTVVYFQKKACSRDKALYYFSEMHPLSFQEQIWFIEEDVYLPTVNTLTRLDQKYKHADLLCRDLIPKSNAPEWKFWHHCPFQEEQCIRTMICMIRLSGRALSSVQDFAKKNQTLFLDEILFPSVATVNKLRIKCPEELQFIRYRDTEKNFPTTPVNVNKNFAYHPIKNLALQKALSGLSITNEVE